MPSVEEWVEDAFVRATQDCCVEPTQHVLRVRIGQQKLEHYIDGRLATSYTVSTGKNPPSCVENSRGTPLGLHRICEKIGDGLPPGMILKGRVPTGQLCWELKGDEAQRNLVTTRILRLRGLQEGYNAGAGCDTYDRYVYIHGTNREDLVGQPATAGCTALKNDEMILLFDSVPEGALVWIER